MSHDRPVIALQPRLALRVGVTGHRRLAQDQIDDLRERVRLALRAITEAATRIKDDQSSGYSVDPPLLRVISPIAEGGDRLVAAEGIQAGYELQCPLPFFREEYSNDFASEESKRAFNGLLEHASAVFELDGERNRSGDNSRESLAYQTVGRVMLTQCDLLIAIWDGEPANGVGGTAQMVAEAASQEIPIIWLQPGKPGMVRLRLCVGESKDCIIEHENWEQQLSKVLDRLLRLPPGEHGSHKGFSTTSHDDFVECLARPFPSPSILGRAWKAFMNLMSFPPRRWKGTPTLPDKSDLPNPFAGEYTLTEAPANYYAGLYRGSFVANYLLGTLAVVLALMAVVAPGWQSMWAWMEIVTIATIVLVIVMVNRGHWHQKSIDCRYYAEQLRHMRFLWPLARVTPSSRPPAHASFGDPRVTSMNWRFRAALRLIGMPDTRVTPEYRARCLGLILDQWIGGPDGQVQYHRGTARRLSRVDHRLHLTARVLFILTAAACIAHLLVHDEGIARWLTLLTGALPAAAAAAHAVSSQGEFRRLAERSRAMASELTHTKRSLRRLDVSRSMFTSTDLYRTISPAAAAMIEEVTDWRILYRKPPIEPA